MQYGRNSYGPSFAEWFDGVVNELFPAIEIFIDSNEAVHLQLEAGFSLVTCRDIMADIIQFCSHIKTISFREEVAVDDTYPVYELLLVRYGSQLEKVPLREMDLMAFKNLIQTCPNIRAVFYFAGGFSD